jgi:uncharacterized protein (DUF58 family)
MKQKAIKFIFLFAFIFAAGAFASSASAQSITGSIGNGTVKRGAATRATVVLNRRSSPLPRARRASAPSVIRAA